MMGERRKMDENVNFAKIALETENFERASSEYQAAALNAHRIIVTLAQMVETSRHAAVNPTSTVAKLERERVIMEQKMEKFEKYVQECAYLASHRYQVSGEEMF